MKVAIGALILTGPAVAFTTPQHATRTTSSTTALSVVGKQAESFGPAGALRKLKSSLPQIEWLATGDGPRNL